MSETARRAFWYGWVILVVGLIAYMAIIGINTYAYPVVMPQMIADRGWARGDTLLAPTLSAWLGIFVYPVLGWVIDRWGGRITLFIGGIGNTLIYLALTQVTELWQWLVLWGVIRAPIVRLSSVLPFQAVANQWFSLRRGFAVGVILMGGGLGGFIAAPVVTWIMETSKSWQWGWGVTGAVIGVTAIVWVIFARSRPSDMGTWPDGLTPEEAQRAREAALARTASSQRAIATTYRSPINWTVRDALRTRAFYMTVLMWAGWSLSFGFAQNHGVLHLTRTARFSSMDAAWTVSIYTIVSAPFRLFMGWLTDRIESRYITLFATVMVAASLAALWAVTPGNYFLLVSYAVLMGIGYGTGYTSISIQLANYFGPGNFATLFASMSAVVGIATGFVPAGGGYIFDITGSYNLAFIILEAYAVIALVAALLGAPPQPKAEQLAARRPTA